MIKDTHKIPNKSDLLITKLSVPIHHSRIVKRTRLTDLLRKGMQSKLTLVVAPAGSGKTTLLREWITITEAIGWQVAWVSLDAEDKGLLKFWAYIVAAIRTIDPDFHFELSNIAGITSDSFNCDLFISLINQIKQIDKHFSLVLDDYHEVKNEQIHKSLSYVIERLPENMHLIIISRVSPPIPLSRLRVRNQLVEIDAINLSFTSEEAEIFMEKVMEVKASSEDIKTLNQITEGWIAGLQLAGLTIKNGRELKSFLSDFGSSNRHISDYLTEEVLNHLEASIKEFLIKTSILSKLSANLCDFVLEINNSQEILLFLEKSNIFIYPLDENRCWYRYHSLFADYLKIHLYNKYPDLVNHFHLRAIQWFESHDYPELAIPHALAAGENEKAADIVQTCALHAINRFDLSTVIQWIDQLPIEIYMKRSQLIVYHLMALLTLGRKVGIEKQFQELNKLEKQFAIEENNIELSRLSSQTCALKAVEAFIKADYCHCIELTEQASANLDDQDYSMLGIGQHFLSLAYLAKGKMLEAVQATKEGLQISSKYGLDREYIVSMCALARIHKLGGKLYDARNVYQDAMDFAQSKSVSMDAINYIKAGLGDIFLEWNQNALANQLTREAYNYFSHFGTNSLEWIYLPELYLLFSKYFILNNDFEKAGKCIQSSYSIINNYHTIPFLLEQTITLNCRLWLVNKNLDEAIRWKERTWKSIDQVSWIEKIALARVFLAIGDANQAANILTNLISKSPKIDIVEYIIEMNILLSLAMRRIKYYEMAKKTLISAIEYAIPGGYSRIFINEGIEIKQMLREIHQDIQSSDPATNDSKSIVKFVETLLSNFDNFKNIKDAPPQAQDLFISSLESFSDREMEILKLLTEGKSPKQIAHQLVVSINTVRTHIKNIYQKLDVHTRSEAIEKAILIKLI